MKKRKNNLQKLNKNSNNLTTNKSKNSKVKILLKLKKEKNNKKLPNNSKKRKIKCLKNWDKKYPKKIKKLLKLNNKQTKLY